jgi:hypothetical protein
MKRPNQVTVITRIPKDVAENIEAAARAGFRSVAGELRKLLVETYSGRPADGNSLQC